jgi:hypothetical protein
MMSQIEGIQKELEAGRIKLYQDFEKWYMQQNPENQELIEAQNMV